MHHTGLRLVLIKMVSVIYYLYKSDIAQIMICEKYCGKKKELQKMLNLL